MGKLRKNFQRPCDVIITICGAILRRADSPPRDLTKPVMWQRSRRGCSLVFRLLTDTDNLTHKEDSPECPEGLLLAAIG